jgi:hypothetical protein
VFEAELARTDRKPSTRRLVNLARKLPPTATANIR